MKVYIMTTTTLMHQRNRKEAGGSSGRGKIQNWREGLPVTLGHLNRLIKRAGNL